MLVLFVLSSILLLYKVNTCQYLLHQYFKTYTMSYYILYCFLFLAHLIKVLVFKKDILEKSKSLNYSLSLYNFNYSRFNLLSLVKR